MPLAQLLVLLASSIFLALGTLHLVYTFFSDNFQAGDAALTESMKIHSPVLTRQTTMWKAWIGFNGSHSSGAMFFGLVNIILAGWYFDVYRHAVSLQVLNLAMSFFYLWLAKKYWFSIPLNGIVIATVCFCGSMIRMYW